MEEEHSSLKAKIDDLRFLDIELCLRNQHYHIESSVRLCGDRPRRGPTTHQNTPCSFKRSSAKREGEKLGPMA